MVPCEAAVVKIISTAVLHAARNFVQRETGKRCSMSNVVKIYLLYMFALLIVAKSSKRNSRHVDLSQLRFIRPGVHWISWKTQRETRDAGYRNSRHRLPYAS